jgi:hypothetical protein
MKEFEGAQIDFFIVNDNTKPDFLRNLEKKNSSDSY